MEHLACVSPLFAIESAVFWEVTAEMISPEDAKSLGFLGFFDGRFPMGEMGIFWWRFQWGYTKGMVSLLENPMNYGGFGDCPILGHKHHQKSIAHGDFKYFFLIEASLLGLCSICLGALCSKSRDHLRPV